MKKRKSTSNSDDVSTLDSLSSALKKEIKAMKAEVKSLMTELKEEQAALEKEKAEANQGRKSLNVEQMKGNGLLKLSQLKRMGFDEKVIKEHLEQENIRLIQLQKDKQQDRKNLDVNIQKMKQMNLQSERAISAAEIQLKKILEENTKEKALLDETEVKLYVAENKVKHSRGMNKAVAITDKEPLRKGIKEIANEVKARCDDKEVVKMVLKVAGRCLATDMESSGASLREQEEESDSSISVEISSCSSEGDD